MKELENSYDSSKTDSNVVDNFSHSSKSLNLESEHFYSNRNTPERSISLSSEKNSFKIELKVMPSAKSEMIKELENEYFNLLNAKEYYKAITKLEKLIFFDPDSNIF